MNRLEPLDWLRDLLAVAIMLYHLAGWTLVHPDASTFLGRMGVYGVSMFFVLSGLSMAVGYHAFIRDVPSALRFFVRRIFRIWPLLWLAVAAAMAAAVLLRGAAIDWALVVLNLTTLFGFVAPGAYINTGAWSIGNEMVYYALTPLFIAAYRRGLAWGNAAVLASCTLGTVFAFAWLDAQQPLAGQWHLYIHPANNLCFYAAGLALFYNLRGTALSPAAALACMAAAAAVFFAYPVQGDLIGTVVTDARLAFFGASVLLVFGFYKLTSSLPAWIAAPLAALGAATYGVYLLHPLVYGAVRVAAKPLPWLASARPAIVATVGLTIVVALVVYRRYELPFIELGRRLTRGGAARSSSMAASTAEPTRPA